jgi:hypothetical protein
MVAAVVGISAMVMAAVIIITAIGIPVITVPESNHRRSIYGRRSVIGSRPIIIWRSINGSRRTISGRWVTRSRNPYPHSNRRQREAKAETEANSPCL